MGVNIWIGSGFRGRDEWLIPQVLWGQLKVAHSEPGDARIHCTSDDRTVFMGTVGGARALGMEDRIGNFDAGREADFIVVDLPVGARWPRRWEGNQSRRPRNARDQTLFALLMSMCEPAISHV